MSFCFFFIHFYVPFKIISAHMRQVNQWVGQKQENPEKIHLLHSSASRTLLVSHLPSVGLEPMPDAVVISILLVV